MCWLLLLLAGCSEGLSSPLSSAARPSVQSVLASAFEPATTGTIQGRVLWVGQVPTVEPFAVLANPLFYPPWPLSEVEKSFPNPNAPVIDSESRGVGNAVVFLRRVDLARSKPWEHGPVRVQLRDYQIQVIQETTLSAVGFVQRGDMVQFVSDEDRYHSVSANRAAFFTLTLPKAGQVRQRPLPSKGLVEITDASEYYWLRGYLFVDDHPYYTRTDARGRFFLPQVPPGEYELVAWMPNWHEARHDRSPESMCIVRLAYRDPVEQTQQIHVSTNQTTTAEFRFRTADFKK
jgi:hypothetical protein